MWPIWPGECLYKYERVQCGLCGLESAYTSERVQCGLCGLESAYTSMREYNVAYVAWRVLIQV